MSIEKNKVGNVSRRKFIATVGAIGVSAGLLYRIASRGKEKGAVGKRLPIPDEPLVNSFHFSPVDGQFAVVAGDLMSKRLYVAEFPPRSARDYKVLVDLPNCIALVAPTWCRSDSKRIAFLATVLNGETAAPVTGESEFRRVLKERGIIDGPDGNVETKLSGGLYTVSGAEKVPKKVCAVKPLPEPGSGPGAAWIESSTIISCEDKQIRRYRLHGDGKGAEVDVLLEAIQEASRKVNDGIWEAFRYLAYHPVDNLLVTLRNGGRNKRGGKRRYEHWTDVLMFDDHGKVQKETRIVPVSNAGEGPSLVLLDKNGETYLQSTIGGDSIETLRVGSITNGTSREVPFDPAAFSLASYGTPDGQMVFLSKDARDLEEGSFRTTIQDRYYVGSM